MKFECQPGCTTCCEQQGFVYLTKEDIIVLARHLEMEGQAFERRYVYRTKNIRRLRVPRHAQCEFLQSGACGVHQAKPAQCRTFPFWPEIIGSRRAWHKTGDWCPGIGKGELVNIENAQATAEIMRASHPHLYA